MKVFQTQTRRGEIEDYIHETNGAYWCRGLQAFLCFPCGLKERYATSNKKNGYCAPWGLLLLIVVYCCYAAIMVAAVGQCLWEDTADATDPTDNDNDDDNDYNFACNREGVRNTTLDWSNDIFLTVLSCLLTVHAWYNVTPNRHLRATTAGAFATITLTSIFETCQKMKFSNSGTDDGYGLLEYYYFEIFIALTSAVTVLLLYQPAWRSWLSIKVDSKGHKTTKCFCGLLWLRLWSTLAIGSGCLLIVVGCGWTIFQNTNVLTLNGSSSPNSNDDDQSSSFQTEQFIDSVVNSFTPNNDGGNNNEVNLLVDDGYPPRSPLPDGSQSIVLIRYGQALWTITTLLFTMVSSVIYIYHAKQPLKGRVYATTPTGLGINMNNNNRRRPSATISHSDSRGGDDDDGSDDDDSIVSSSRRRSNNNRSRRNGNGNGSGHSTSRRRVVLPRDYHQRGVFGLTTIWSAVLLLVTQITTMILYFGLFVVDTKIVNGNALLRQPNIQVLQAGFIGFFQVLTVFLLYSCIVSLFPLHIEEDNDEDTTDGSTGPSGSSSDDDDDQDFAVVRQSHMMVSSRRADISSSSSSSSHSSSSSASISISSSMDDVVVDDDDGFSVGDSYDDQSHDDDDEDLEEQSSYDSSSRKKRHGRPTRHNVNAFMFVMLTHNLQTQHSTQTNDDDHTMSEDSSAPDSSLDVEENSDEATNDSHSLSAKSNQASVGATSSSSSSVWKRPLLMRRSRVTRPMTRNNQVRRQSSSTTTPFGRKSSSGRPPLPPTRRKNNSGMSHYCEESIQELRAESEEQEQIDEVVESRDQGGEQSKRKSLLGNFFGGNGGRKNRTRRKNQKKMRNYRHRKATNREGKTTTSIRVAEGDAINSNVNMTELNLARSSQLNLADSTSHDGNSIVSSCSPSANEGNASIGGESDDTDVFDNRAETIESRRFKTIDNLSVDTPPPSHDHDDTSRIVMSENDNTITANESVISEDEQQQPANFDSDTMTRDPSTVSASAMIVRNSSLRSSTSKGKTKGKVTSRRLTWAATVEDHVRSVTCQPMKIHNANILRQEGESWDEEFDRENPSILANVEHCSFMDELAARALPQCDHDLTCVEAIEAYIMATAPGQNHQQNISIQPSQSNASSGQWDTLIAIPIDNTACASEPEATATKNINERSGNLVTKMGGMILSRFGGGRKQHRSISSETPRRSIVDDAESEDACDSDDDDDDEDQEGDIRSAISNLSTSAHATGQLVSSKSMEIVKDTGNMMVEMYNDPCPGVESPLKSSSKPREQYPSKNDDNSATAAADDVSQISLGETLAQHLGKFFSSDDTIDNASRDALLSHSSSSLEETEISRLESIDRLNTNGSDDDEIEGEDDETNGNNVDVPLENDSSVSSDSSDSDPTIEVDQEQNDDVSSMGGDTASLFGAEQKPNTYSSRRNGVAAKSRGKTKQHSTSKFSSPLPPRPTRKSELLPAGQRDDITPTRSSSSISSRSENQSINPKEISNASFSLEKPIAQTRSISAISMDSIKLGERPTPMINNGDSKKQMGEERKPECTARESKPWSSTSSRGQKTSPTVASNVTKIAIPRKSLEVSGLRLDLDTDDDDDDVPVVDSRNDINVDMKDNRGSYQNPYYDRSRRNGVKSNAFRAVSDEERTVTSPTNNLVEEMDGQSMSPSPLARQPSPSLYYAPKVSDMRMLFERN